MCARSAFNLSPQDANIHHMKLAHKLASKNSRGNNNYNLKVEVHCGIPLLKYDKKGYYCTQTRFDILEKNNKDNNFKIFKRQLVYYNPCQYNKCTMQTNRGREKGIDTAIISSILHSIYNNECDIVIIMSHDSDLAPPIESLIENRYESRIEIASWREDDPNKTLIQPNGKYKAFNKSIPNKYNI